METIIEGRPDFGHPNCGVTEVKSFPKYVYGTSRLAALIHKVSHVRAYWYKAQYDHLRRLQTPKIIATSICGQSFFIHIPDDSRHLLLDIFSASARP